MECSDSIIIPLQNTSQVLHQLPLSTLSILLFTAAWSIESQYARDVVRNASCRVKCGFSSIQVYELSWPTRPPTSSWDRLVFDTVLSEQWPSSIIANGLRKGAAKRRNAEGHRNITSAVRWLPCVQLYTNRTGYVRPWMYRDSFEEEALVSELERFCERNAMLPLPTVQAMATSEPNARMLRSEEKETSAGRIRLLSKDEFAKALDTNATAKNTGSAKMVGIMVLLHGGLQSMLERHDSVWQLISTTVSASTWQNKLQWLLTVVDSQSHVNLVQRLGVYNIVSQNGIALVLLNGAADENKVLHLTTNIESVQCLTEELESFAYHKSSSDTGCRMKPAHRLDNLEVERKQFERMVELLQTLPKPAVWRTYFDVDQSRISLVDWLRGNYKNEETTQTMVWVVVYETWCAFCQRHLGVYKKLKAMVEKAGVVVEVVIIEGCAGLSGWMDAMVDGFPTVLIIRSLGRQTQVDEYKGEHEIGALIHEHDAVNIEKLMRVAVQRHDIK